MNSKSIILKTAALAFLFSLAACSNSSESQNKEVADEKASRASSTSQALSAGNVKFNDDKLNAIYPWYLELQEALVVEDFSAAKKAAFAIEEGSRQLNSSSEMLTTASEIVEASDIARQRELFQTLTAEMIAQVKSSGLQSGEVFIAHCPMAFDNTGADWLSSTKEIRNPYYGDEMLTCGSVEETI